MSRRSDGGIHAHGVAEFVGERARQRGKPFLEAHQAADLLALMGVVLGAQHREQGRARVAVDPGDPGHARGELDVGALGAEYTDRECAGERVGEAVSEPAAGDHVERFAVVAPGSADQQPAEHAKRRGR